MAALQGTQTDEAETQRLAALHRYDVLDTPPEESIDRITRLACALLGTPVAFVGLIDADRQWMKSRQGDIHIEVARRDSFCDLTIRQDDAIVVDDARLDPRFDTNPSVTSPQGVRFYIGVPLRTPSGHNIGTLCAIDRQPRSVTQEQVAILKDLARIVIDELELRAMARTDSLTGLLTRRAFWAEASRELERASRHTRAFSLLVMDIDHFKRINDTFGHDAGDRALRAAARIAQNELRGVDILGRLGGEELIAALPDTASPGAVEVAERLRQAIAAGDLIGDGRTRVTISIGVATARSTNSGVDDLVKRADRYLYAAKKGGRNCVLSDRMRVALPVAS